MLNLLHDLHIHTPLSSCSNDPEQTVENIVSYAARNGIPVVGIANHVWDREIPGSSDWYAPQDFEHISLIRNQIPADLHGVRLLIGAETEFAGGKIALTRAHRDELDYVLVPHSHIHMRGLVLPETCVTDQQVADYLVDSFLNLVQQDFATIIAHPFYGVGRTPENCALLHRRARSSRRHRNQWRLLCQGMGTPGTAARARAHVLHCPRLRRNLLSGQRRS